MELQPLLQKNPSQECLSDHQEAIPQDDSKTSNNIVNKEVEPVPSTSRDQGARTSGQPPSREEESSNSPGVNPEDLLKNARRQRRLNTLLLEAVYNCDRQEVQKLLDAGASPNATCHTEHITACHLAALYNNDILSLLLRHGAEGHRSDRRGRTPLHLASWAGHVRHVAALLPNFPEELQEEIEIGKHTTPETEKRILKLREDSKDIIDVKCGVKTVVVQVPDAWKDGLDHDCKDLQLPLLGEGWTALHAASCSAQPRCCRLLLAAGTWPDELDAKERTPLQVAGTACHYTQHDKQPFGPALLNIGFAEVIRIFLIKTCETNTIFDFATQTNSLHTAVELENLEATELLLEARMSPVFWNKDGLTPLHMCVAKRLKRHLQAFTLSYSYKTPQPLVDQRDKRGQTVLYSATAIDWYTGVCIALEAGADITIKNQNGETPLHKAAARGNLKILGELLKCTNALSVINSLDNYEHTALFYAVKNGHTGCIKILLVKGSSIQIVYPQYGSVFHVAANEGRIDVLELLYYLKKLAGLNVVIDERNEELYTPLHIAVKNNHIDCVKFLISKLGRTFLNIPDKYGGTPLQTAAKYNYGKIADVIMRSNHSTLYDIGTDIWTPLHTAADYASRDVIKVMIHNGADLSRNISEFKILKVTAIEEIMNKLSEPIEFLESVFDTYICNSRDSPLDPVSFVTLDFRALSPRDSTNGTRFDTKMSVIDALLKSGNRHKQRRLLLHPLIESYVILKWNVIRPFIILELCLYAMFVAVLTIFVVSEYFFKDNTVQGSIKPAVFNITFWTCALYITAVLIILLEIVYNASSKLLFLRQLETWVRGITIVMAYILPNIIKKSPSQSDDTSMDWPRYTATATILLAWLNMTYFMAKVIPWGYFILMYKKVSLNVLKILLTFTFLIVGFALSFMIQLHSNTPFDNPWTAFVKTMVMMTSEFDYNEVFNKNESEGIGHSLVVRALFLIFLTLAAIVLMNLMLGVAINDVGNLEETGRIMQLEKQVEFLSSLNNLVFKAAFIWFLPNKRSITLKGELIKNIIIINPYDPNSMYYKIIPLRVRTGIYEKARMNMKNKHLDKQLDALTHSDLLSEQEYYDWLG